MCIAEYIIGNKVGKDTVTTILDSLKITKSPCFRKHNDTLAKSYNRIWKHLSPQQRRLLTWGIDGTAMLNDSGLALKKGLDYYKDLGDAFNDIRGLFDDFPF